MVIAMQREITVKELENIDEIEEPIIVKRDNKKDLVVLSLEEYRKKIFLNETSSKLEESEEQYKKGRTHNARAVFKELRKNMDTKK